MRKSAFSRRLPAVSCLMAVACASVGTAVQREEIGSLVRVHRIYPVPAEAAPADQPQAPAAAAAADTAPVRLEDLPRLTVRGNAAIEKPADRLLLEVGVVTQKPTPSETLQENSRLMELVVKAIRKAGLEASEFETGNFDLQPIHSQRPMQAGHDWEPKIVAYRAVNTVRVKTRKLDLAGQLIQAANDAGANQIGSISFDLADPRVHRAEAIRSATANALTDARTLAEAAGVALVRIVSIDLDPFIHQPVWGAGEMRMAAAAAAPPMAPGDVTVTAGVTIVYEIR